MPPLVVSFYVDKSLPFGIVPYSSGGYAGNALSILDGIFVAIKDDINLYPHTTKGRSLTCQLSTNLFARFI